LQSGTCHRSDMTDDLTKLETWASPLLAKLGAKERSTVARTIARRLRQSQAQRIAQQQNPDGSGYEPRKPRARAKKGRIRNQAMFGKLRTTKFLRIKFNPNEAAVEFIGRVSRIARVHQEGGTDLVSKQGPRIRYPQRQLLGFSAADVRMIQDVLVEMLAP